MRNKFAISMNKFWRKNGSKVLTVLGIFGTVTTTVLAVEATPKAMLLLDEKREEKGSDLTISETIGTAIGAYVPTIISGVSTISCIVGIDILNQRQQATLASCYMFLENSYKEYRKKLCDIYGKDADNTIMEALNAEKAEKIAFSTQNFFPSEDLPDDDSQVHTFYDEFSSRYFESTFAAVKNAEYHLNRNFALRGFTDMYEFHDFLGIVPDPNDSLYGWSQWMMIDAGLEGGWIDFDHRKVLLEDGMECYIISTPYEPCVNFDLW